ncbi:MAG: methyltransferase domain-containing protein [Crenarchaeota archaeon]|nr:methyltransferase domain-containing protein [Thermoproteota archaeon]
MDLRSKRELEIILENVKPFSRPKINLEQYVTDCSIVAELVWLSYIRGEIRNSTVLDLGCGTGRFAIAAALLGARSVICLDIDKDAIIDSKMNIRSLNVDYIVDTVVADVRYLPFRGKVFDVVFQNPPFGIQSRRGMDIEFLRAAMSSGRIVYTIHKAKTLDYVVRRIVESGHRVAVVGERVINVPMIYGHHRKRVHKVRVVLLYVY